ncbi:Phage capsid family protein [Mycobacterium marinum]|uniref:Phage capsid family protein n=1 Tax=Mycobacterium marinum TaxID=1781 RepID=A0A3E2MVI1_MYCMR|nr:phage major capsid protein [Mycobacterium marinum]RFZ40876.1 Phage capsid family protein [Mycobacterium marinum]
MNNSALEAKGRELNGRLQSFGTDVENNPAYTETQKENLYKSLQADFDAWEADCKRYKNTTTEFMKKMGANPGGQLTDQPATNIQLFDGLVDSKNITHTGGQLAPLTFDSAAISAISKSYETSQPIRTKAFSAEVKTTSLPSMEGLLPAQLAPGVAARIWDVRVADLLPAVPATSSSYEYLKDTTSSATQAAVVGEGQTKPQVDITLTSEIIKFAKIAGLIKLSREQISDFSQSLGYSINQLQKNIISKENQQLLYGDGSTNGDGSVNMVGFANVSGIGSHTAGSLTGSESHLDSILAAIDAMRTGAAKASPSFALVHPTTWHAICLEKDGLNRSLVSPDPTRDTALKVWDVPVKLSTDVTLGDMFFIDTTKMGYMVVREGLVINGPAHDQDDFSKNLASWVAELRENLAVVRATAVYLLQGLPTTITAP